MFIFIFGNVTGEMLTPENYNFIYFIFYFFAAERWRVKISGYKLRYNRAAEGKQTKNSNSVHTLTVAISCSLRKEQAYVYSYRK